MPRKATKQIHPTIVADGLAHKIPTADVSVGVMALIFVETQAPRAQPYASLADPDAPPAAGLTIAHPTAAQTAILIATVILAEFKQSRDGVFCGTHRPVSFENDMTHTIPHLTFDIFNDDTWTALQNVACPKLPHQRVVRLDFWVPTRDNGFLVREASMSVQEPRPIRHIQRS